jgi:hypothetical protein
MLRSHVSITPGSFPSLFVVRFLGREFIEKLFRQRARAQALDAHDAQSLIREGPARRQVRRSRLLHRDLLSKKKTT